MSGLDPPQKEPIKWPESGERREGYSHISQEWIRKKNISHTGHNICFQRGTYSSYFPYSPKSTYSPSTPIPQSPPAPPTPPTPPSPSVPSTQPTPQSPSTPPNQPTPSNPPTLSIPLTNSCLYTPYIIRNPEESLNHVSARSFPPTSSQSQNNTTHLVERWFLTHPRY